MVKMPSWKESLLLRTIECAAAVFRFLPYRFSLSIARQVGMLGYYFLPKKRRVIYGNLKTAFAHSKTPQELNEITKKVFTSVTQNFMDVMYIPKIKQDGYQKYMHLKNRHHVDDALKQGKGVILLAVHSGSWELASIVGSSIGYTYNIVANQQPKVPLLDKVLNEYRAKAGAKIIPPGTGITRDIIRALNHNELVSLVLDMGGEEGLPVPFLGKTASLSIGALKLALKYKVPVCPVWVTRGSDGKSTLEALPLLPLQGLDVKTGLSQALLIAANVFEKLFKQHPHEYLWFYKFYKYSTQSEIMILDDGKTGHLRQSQATAAILSEVLRKNGKAVHVSSVGIEFKSDMHQKLFSVYAGIVAWGRLDAREEEMEFFLKKVSFDALVKQRADWLISCGSTTGGINFFLKQCMDVKSICILKAGLVPWENFNLAIAPEHDQRPTTAKGHCVFTKAALNLVTPGYLNEQQELLLKHFSHLKNNVRFKIGILLGGNTKGVIFDEAQIRLLLSQVKEAAKHYNADILITTSRRTPLEVENLITKELKNFDRTALCIIANINNSPYAVGGILALSDLLIVSGESISMVSEAISSRKKTIVFKPQGNYEHLKRLNKFDAFVLSLSDQGFILACSIKEISNSITKMMSNKLTLKSLQDNALIQKAIEKIAS